MKINFTEARVIWASVATITLLNPDKQTIINLPTIMLKSILSFFIGLVIATAATAQITITKDGKDFFNGDDRHLYAYLNNNYYELDPLEGIWMFTRIEYNSWGVEVSRTPNEYKAAIVRDKGNPRRAFVEINFNRSFCKAYQITYSIQQSGGSGYYPLEPEGCSSAAGHYTFNTLNNTISRPGLSFTGNSAVLVGIRIFPQGPPTEIMPMPGGTVAQEGAVTPRVARTISHASGWEPYIDWGKNIFPSYLLSMSTLDPKTFPVGDDYLGDPLSVVGILMNAPKSGTMVQVEIEATPYSRAVSETYTLDKKNKQYAIFPPMIWDFEKLRQIQQARPLSFVYKITVNGKTVTQSATANLRALDDCPLYSFDYKGDPVDLKFLAAAYVNEGHPQIKTFTKEIRQKGLIRDFTGIQAGDESAVQQVYAFWKLLRDKGISYSSITNNGQEDKEVASQRIRLLEDIIDETQANCIDGTALLSSCLEAISIPSVLIFVPGHAFLGYYTKDSEGKIKNIYFLETTMLGGTLSSVPNEAASLLEQEPYKTMRKALYSQFNGGRSAKNAELEHFLYASLSAEYTYKKYVKEAPEKVMMVEVTQARKLVRPIFREEAAGSRTYQDLSQNTRPKNVTPPTIQPDNINPGNKQAPPVVVQPEQSGQITGMTSPEMAPNFSVLPVYKGTESYDMSEYKTDAPAKQGEYYKIQIETSSNYTKRKYETLSTFGHIDTEWLMPEGKRMRFLIGDFATYEKALPGAKKAQSLGYNNVAIVKYKDGNRLNSMYRDWKQL